MSILAEILATKRRELAQRQAVRSLEALRALPRETPARDFKGALREPGLAVIAEIKRRSPSKGVLSEGLHVETLAQAYARGGAAALSVLTDADYFGGSEADLQAARAAVGLPVLRKDFTIDPYQIWEARSIGADAVLLIVAALAPSQLCDLLACAREAGLAVLVEVHDAAELEIALTSGAAIIGVNNRDLRTFAVSLETSLRLRPLIPADRVSVAESGIETADDAARLADAGFDALLVGESLVRSGDPGGAVQMLRSSGQEPRG